MAADAEAGVYAEVAELRRALDGPTAAERVTEIWLKPIRRQYAVMAGTMDKPVGELTTTEAACWFTCLGYAAMTGLIAGAVAVRILAVILGVRP